MTHSFIGIGSNLGNKEENIRKAVELIKKKCKILKKSSLYETEPIGFKKQDWFLNSVVEIETGLKPIELLEFLQSIEKNLKRAKTIKYGPRIIDLDILFYGNEILKEKNLVVPHPRLHERLFVLEPLKEIAPRFVHPVLKKKIDELHSGFKKEQIVRRLKNL